jgi:ABC-type antimicrobial peptide transport system permease subunit
MDCRLIAIFLAIAILTGLISGLLPALYLASSNPADALKGTKMAGHSFSLLRQSIIVFQFTIPVILIICMMIIKSQDSFMRNYDAGVDKDKVIILENSINIQKHAEAVKAELLAIPGIESVSFTNCIPTRGAPVSSEVDWDGKDATEKLHFWCVNADFDYNKVVKVNIVNGRFFNSEYSTDSNAYLINDVSARVMKNKNPVGSSITVNGQKGNIIGVFKDFHSIDLAGPLVPTIIQIKSNDSPNILVKFSSGSYQTISGAIRDVFKHYDIEGTFKATLFRDLIPYTNLNLPSKLVGVAFIISLSLACMGFFGLASFTSENRRKEIGIRKVHGATIISVLGLLLTSFARWLSIAFVLSVPIAFILGKIFLGRFYFHTPMPLWAFFAGPLIALFVALLTVSSQTWRVASQNPVKALRNE